MKERSVHKTVKGQRAIDGAGVHLVRVIGYRTVKDFDPFLMLDAFDSTNPDDYTAGFPYHPHRGIETVTYLVKGNMEHQDSLGNKGVIVDGSCQWMTAGSGIMHQEMPQASEHMLGLQLWINLPAKDKMATPKYRNLTSENIPVVQENGAVVRVLSGIYQDTPGAMQADYVQASYLDIELEPNASLSVNTKAGETVFFYIMTGSTSVAGAEQLAAKQAVLLGDGDVVHFKAGAEGTRLMLLMGAPLKEPVAWGGPIVMNTDDELRTAYFELEDNTFIKESGECTEGC